jgi:C-terminal processing protease CtpA/Prc
MRRIRLTALLLVITLGVATTFAQEGPRPLLTERLAGLGRVWGAVKFFHPFLAYKAIDWDGALVHAIPKVKAARTPEEYRASIDSMLQALDDPATTADLAVTAGSSSSPPPPPMGEPTYFRVVEDHVVVRAIDWARTFASASNTTFAKREQMLTEIGRAKGIVIDCRYADVSYATLQPFYLNAYLENVLPSLVQGVVPLGTERYRLYSGYAPQQGNTSGGYTSAFLTQTPRAITGQAGFNKPLAVLIDERTPSLLPVLSGLQAKGARIVQVGNRTNGTGGRQHRMLLPDGVRVTMRVAEFVHPGGGSTFQADVVLANGAGADDRAILAAIATLSTPANRAATKTVSETMLAQQDNPYAQMSTPTEEYRLLALFRFWNVINYFYPYKPLMDQPWGAVLTDFIPRFMEGTSALDYQTTVAEMVARLQDSHGFVRGLQDLEQHLGTFAPAIRLASAGSKLVVADLVDVAAAEAAGIRIGDVIVTIDGEPTARRVAALTKLRALSTPQSAYAFIYPSVLRGAKDSRVTLRVEGIDGHARDVELIRTVPLGSVGGMLVRKTPVYQVLPDGYGYVDLARLPLADAQKAMDAVLKTPAVVFDMRGYPNSTAWAIAPRLTDKTNVTAALFRRPLQLATNFDDEDLGGGTPDYAFAQKLPVADGAIYRGKVVMLINEFAISQSEHTCLFFESATHITFVGSPTNGANGDVTNVALPGNIYVNFTGHDVRHADGRQLQRVGIQPDIHVEPTPRGISERRDEVLEAALTYLDATFTR